MKRRLFRVQNSLRVSTIYIRLSICLFLLKVKFFILSEIDECNYGTDKYSPNAVCNNTYGDYNCSCKTGFEGNGFNCTGKKVCIILQELSSVVLISLLLTSILELRSRYCSSIFTVF